MKTNKYYPKGWQDHDYFDLDMAMKFVAEKFGKKFSRDNKRTIVKLGLNGTVETKTFDEFAGIKDGKKSTKGYSKKDLIKYFKT